MAYAVNAGCEVGAVKLLESEDELEHLVWTEVIKLAYQEKQQDMRQQAILIANYVLKGLSGKK